MWQVTGRIGLETACSWPLFPPGVQKVVPTEGVLTIGCAVAGSIKLQRVRAAPRTHFHIRRDNPEREFSHHGAVGPGPAGLRRNHEALRSSDPRLQPQKDADPKTKEETTHLRLTLAYLISAFKSPHFRAKKLRCQTS